MLLPPRWQQHLEEEVSRLTAERDAERHAANQLRQRLAAAEAAAAAAAAAVEAPPAMDSRQRVPAALEVDTAAATLASLDSRNACLRRNAEKLAAQNESLRRQLRGARTDLAVATTTATAKALDDGDADAVAEALTVELEQARRQLAAARPDARVLALESELRAANAELCRLRLTSLSRAVRY
jgi:chromosome segregation ATPase